MFTINKCVYNHPPEDFAGKHLGVITFLMCVRKALSMPDSGEALNEHGSSGISRVKLPCTSKESFSLDSRVGASQNSLAH